jgi:hypothetical protein
VRQVEPAELRRAVLDNETPAHGVLHRLGLLEDLLEHEVRKAAALDGAEVPVDAVHLAGARDGVDVEHAIAAGLEHGHVAVLEVDDLARVRKDRRHVGGDEVLVLAEPEEERAPLARGNDLVRVDRRDHGDPVRPLHLPQRLEHRILEVAVEALLDQVREHLGVGIRREDVAAPLEHLLEDGRVLDDPVMHHRDGAVLAHVRVRILLVRRPVGRPSRMRDPRRPFHGRGDEERLELAIFPASFTVFTPVPFMIATPAES